MQLININDAAAVSGKSIQTIRRMIKQKKVQVKRQKTPQGFNYLIVKESLIEHINQSNQTPIQDTANNHADTHSDIQNEEREHRPITSSFEELFKAEVERFNVTIQKLIEQNDRDKSNFFQLIKTFQDRVLNLEGHIKMLEQPKKPWWKVKMW